jgi:16S rRNA G966 N2-methylase RsmD
MSSNKNMQNITPYDYPLYNKYYNLTVERFDELIKNFKPVIIDYIPRQLKYKNSIEKCNGKYLLIKEDWDGNEEINNITDYFSEVVRIQCNFKNHESPFNYWVRNKTKLANLDIKTFRDRMYKEIKFCNNFRVSVAMTILDLFNANKVLDISAGWGDRLIAAIGYGVKKYVGVDPNKDLHPCYKNMIKTLVEPSQRKNFVLIDDGFEFAKIPKYKYDLVFSSPPFFDSEEYSTSEKDSLVAHSTVQSWYNNFLIPSLNKAHSKLIKGGFLVLYMADSPSTKYIENMVLYLNNLMQSCGSIYYFYETSYNPRRIYVWKKI